MDVDSVSMAPSSSYTAMEPKGTNMSNGHSRQAAVRSPWAARTLLREASRASVEFAAFVVAQPRLRQAPRGDGHPVLVVPGFRASDDSTRTLRWYLRDRGYHAHGWRLGTNRGPSQETSTALASRLLGLAAGGPVSIIGWSLGGVYALELAGAFPDVVRRVITLGSPLPLVSQRGRKAPVPVSALFSRTDGIVPWRNAIGPAGPDRENIEVDGSHMGLSHNPKVLLIIADRLALRQPE
jgi:pimeloyl-ACP methyl ester carboxylesterase